MEFRFYRIKVIARIAVLFLSLLIIVYSVLTGQRYVTVTVFGILVIAELVELFRFLDRSNRQIAAFVENVSRDEYTDRLTGIKFSDDYSKLGKILGKILDDLKRTRLEAEMQFQYLQYVVSYIDTGLVCAGEGGKVVLSNPAFHDYVGIKPANIGALEKDNHEIFQLLKNGKAGDRKLVYKRINGKPVRLSLRLAEFRLGGETYKICWLQDIKHELEEQESESWQKLIRVMNHEIMNSVTPINSLSQAIMDELGHMEKLQKPCPDIEESIRDITESADTIYERTKGLMQFINTFRSISRMPRPVFEDVNLCELVDHTYNLVKKSLEEKGIAFEFTSDQPGYPVRADREMLTRVLINLMKNAVEALEGAVSGALIRIRITGPAKSPVLEVHDNGPGIPQANLPEIFVPFFSTRQNGSGIGLSVCRQIMRLHHGSVYAVSDGDSGTSFFLEF